MEHANAVSRARQPADQRYRQRSDSCTSSNARWVSFRRALPTWPEGTEPEFRKVEVLKIDGRSYYAWQEAVEREVDVGELGLSDLAAGPLQIPVHIFRPARAGAFA